MATLALRSLCAVAFCGLAFGGDLKIVTRLQSESGSYSPPPSTFTRYFHGPRSRSESRSGAGHAARPGDKPVYTWGPRQASIQQCDARRSLMLNLDAREYTSTELDDRGIPVGYKPPAIVRQDQGRVSVEIFIDTVDTGERKEMFGRTARHIITHERRVVSPESCQHNISNETDGWYVDLDVPSQSCHALPRKATTGGGVLAIASLCAQQKLEVHRTGVAETGFPVKLTSTTHTSLKQPDGSTKDYSSSFTNEVIELSEAQLDPALFEVPAGYKLVARLNTQPPVPTMVAIEMWWERLKHAIRGRLGQRSFL